MKIGDIVKHKLTGDNVLILSLVIIDNDNTFKDYVVRLPNYAEIAVKEFELEEVKE